jgi:hypothetical protein
MRLHKTIIETSQKSQNQTRSRECLKIYTGQRRIKYFNIINPQDAYNRDHHSKSKYSVNSLSIHVFFSTKTEPAKLQFKKKSTVLRDLKPIPTGTMLAPPLKM